MKLLTTAMLFCTFVSCKKVEQCFEHTGNLSEKEIDVINEFEAITINTEANIHLQNGTNPTVRIVGGENIISNIYTSVQGNVLKIGEDNACRWSKKYDLPDIYITIHDIRKLIMNGSGNVYTVDTLTLDQCSFHSYGSGDFHLTLDVNWVEFVSEFMADFYINGASDGMQVTSFEHGVFYGANFPVNYINVDHYGVNKFEVYPIKKLTGFVRAGHIYYYHKPELVNVKIYGNGKVEYKED